MNRLQPIEFQQARRTSEEPLFNSLMESHHYLGYEQPVGEHLKYLVWAQSRPIAALAWSSAPRQLNLRDQFVGAPKEAYRHNLHCVAYNTRYLIAPFYKFAPLPFVFCGVNWSRAGRTPRWPRRAPR